MESLVLLENWQSTLQETLNGQKDEIDPKKDKAHFRGEIRRMRDGYKRELFEGNEHTFRHEIEGLQMLLNLIEQLTPIRLGILLRQTRGGNFAASYLRNSSTISNPEKIVTIQSKSEYELLFKIASDPVNREDLRD